MKQKSKKVYVLGSDSIGWSIDKDRQYTIKAIKDIDGYEVVDNIFKADIIYAVWWNQLLSYKFRIFNLFFKKRVIACITNDLAHQQKEIKSILSLADIFVYANSFQKDQLFELGVKEEQLFFNPFYVDETIFKKLNFSKYELAKKFNIKYETIKDKLLIGSFQRDSLGTDLMKPKWQKNPDLLLEILNRLDKDKYLLLLAGPRRHYIIKKCKEFNIPYFFIGNEDYIDKNQDDLLVNALNIEDMPYLYNLIDLYIVSSKSEGGPKAVPEAVLCQTNIISTDVGFAKDLLDNKAIYKDSYEAVKLINNVIDNNIEFNHKVHQFYSFDNFKNRVENILKAIE
ncbi:glycosyltransferase [Hydrogenimonas thermophila]|uniref:glycosyltransferase n=1 Tax=Hydrogenimonas thermophila TaxID=223786 RepID=UPI0029372985|nr:glycosyltransferase [Hydrogenimonas thermophila]WOE70109.1 glycosyltransferase [Hydrogenimonas thermophila]WOE72626.1 glycosyltransferase [Hydrogenimonas thermophila]